MKNVECPYEAGVLDAIESGEWSDELREHCTACPVCRDLAEVAHTFSDEYAGLLSEARVPPADLVWWCARLRQRQEAARQATRPITLIHALAVSCAIGVVLAMGRLMFAPASELVQRLAGTLSDGYARLLPVAATAAEAAGGSGFLGIALILALASFLASAPVAVWLIFSDD